MTKTKGVMNEFPITQGVAMSVSLEDIFPGVTDAGADLSTHPIQQLIGYNEFKETVEIGRRLQAELGLIENPRYTWSIFPEWRELIEADSKRKHDYMLALEASSAMKFELIHHNYRFQLTKNRNEIKLLKDKVISLTAANLDLYESAREWQSRYSHFLDRNEHD